MRVRRWLDQPYMAITPRWIMLGAITVTFLAGFVWGVVLGVAAS